MRKLLAFFAVVALFGAAQLYSLGQQGLITGSSPGSGSGSSSSSTSVSTTPLSGVLSWVSNSSTTHLFTQNAFSTIAAVVSASTGFPNGVAYSTDTNSIALTTAGVYMAAINVTLVSASSGAIFQFSLIDQNSVSYPQFRFSVQVASGGTTYSGSGVAISTFVANQKLTPVVRCTNLSASSLTVTAFSFSITSLGGATGATGPAGAAGSNGTNGSNALPLPEGATNYLTNPSSGTSWNVPNSTMIAARVQATSGTFTNLQVNGSGASLINGATSLTLVYNAGGSASSTTVSLQGNGNMYQNGVLFTGSSSGSGSSNYKEVQFQPYSAKLSTGMNSKGAGLVSGTSYFYLQYSADVTNGAMWQAMIPNDYSTTTATVDIDYVAGSGATSGVIAWNAFLSTSTITGWGVANSTIVNVSPVAGERTRCSVDLNTPNLAAQSWYRLRIDRDADNASDTLTSSATIVGARLRYK